MLYVYRYVFTKLLKGVTYFQQPGQEYPHEIQKKDD